jgi:hypothetical protein
VIRYIFVFVVISLSNSFVWAADFVDVRRLISEGLYTQALLELDALDKSVSGEADRAKLEFIQAQALALSGAMDEAIDVYQNLAQKFPANPEPYLNLSTLYADQGDLELAREWAIKGLRSEENYKKLYDNLASIHGVLAANAYRAALNDPSTVTAPALAVSNEIEIEEPPLIEITSEVPAEMDSLVGADTITEIDAQIEVETQVEVVTQAEVESQAKENALSESQEYIEIKAFVLSWAEDWANQDVEGYISRYIETYAPAGITHTEWVQQRRVRLTNKGFIKVAVEQVNITNVDDVWQAEFWQTYESDSIQDTIKKRLSLEQVLDSWLISAEEVL